MIFKYRLHSYLFAIVLLCLFAKADSQSRIEFSPLQKLIARQAPSLSGKVKFVEQPATGGKEVFELETKNNTLIITASSKPAAAQGLNWYLKHYAHQMLSYNGSSIRPLTRLPAIPQKERHESFAQYRYALNYCTFNYTMSFWRWEDWEKELDWQALNGVNLSLAITGVEQVWYNVLKRLSFSDDEINSFIPGPAYTAWWLMGNLEGWGGPMPEQMRWQQAALQQKILKRMRALGIEPELHGFYGMVPSFLSKKYPDAKIIDQGKWAGGFNRPAMLDPTDPLFQTIGNIYYEELKKLYGSDIHFFGGDPFHEGGKTEGLNVAQAGVNIQQLMQKHFPRSTWLLMGWGGNPKDELLARLDKKHTIVLDLFGEASNEWERRKSFNGFPFIWNIVSNFGGKEGLYGKLERFTIEPRRAATLYTGTFKGIGTMPEGKADNPIVYDLIYSLPWMKQNENIKDYISKYPVYRYGKVDPAASRAWELFLETAYFSNPARQEGPTESLLCARPAFNISAVSTWGTRKLFYDPALFEKGVKHLIDASATFKNISSYRFDLVDAVRQVVANKSQVFHERMKQAFEKKDAPAFKKASQTFLRLILLQDSLLKGDRRFMLATFLDQARKMGTNKASSDLCEKNAKWLITIWGPDDPNTDLHEYSHREWSGLLSTLYFERWKAFIDQQQLVLEGKLVNPKAIDFFTMEKQWANTTGGQFASTPAKDYVSLAKYVFTTVTALQ